MKKWIERHLARFGIERDRPPAIRLPFIVVSMKYQGAVPVDAEELSVQLELSVAQDGITP